MHLFAAASEPSPKVCRSSTFTSEILPDAVSKPLRFNMLTVASILAILLLSSQTPNRDRAAAIRVIDPNKAEAAGRAV